MHALSGDARPAAAAAPQLRRAVDASAFCTWRNSPVFEKFFPFSLFSPSETLEPALSHDSRFVPPARPPGPFSAAGCAAAACAAARLHPCTRLTHAPWLEYQRCRVGRAAGLRLPRGGALAGAACACIPAVSRCLAPTGACIRTSAPAPARHATRAILPEARAVAGLLRRLGALGAQRPGGCLPALGRRQASSRASVDSAPARRRAGPAGRPCGVRAARRAELRAAHAASGVSGPVLAPRAMADQTPTESQRPRQRPEFQRTLPAAAAAPEPPPLVPIAQLPPGFQYLPPFGPQLPPPWWFGVPGGVPPPVFPVPNPMMYASTLPVPQPAPWPVSANSCNRDHGRRPTGLPVSFCICGTTPIRSWSLLFLILCAWPAPTEPSFRLVFVFLGVGCCPPSMFACRRLHWLHTARLIICVVCSLAFCRRDMLFQGRGSGRRARTPPSPYPWLIRPIFGRRSRRSWPPFPLRPHTSKPR